MRRRISDHIHMTRLGYLEKDNTKKITKTQKMISTGMIFWSMSREYVPTQISEHGIIEDDTLLSSEVISPRGDGSQNIGKAIARKMIHDRNLKGSRKDKLILDKEVMWFNNLMGHTTRSTMLRW